MIEAAATEREAFEAWAADMEKKSGGPIPRLERALLQEGWQARAALSQQAAPAEPVAWRDHVEGRLNDWRQRFVNKSGDSLGLDDFMDKESLDDLIDFVCDEWATPPAPEAQP
jgi:hypothetical protein